MKSRTEEVRSEAFSTVVLVCANDRDGEYACCTDAGADAVREAIVGWLRDREAYWSGVAVARTSCLGLCSEGGVAVAVQPRDRWYSDVTPADVPELMAGEFGADAARVGRVADEHPASSDP